MPATLISLRWYNATQGKQGKRKLCMLTMVVQRKVRYADLPRYLPLRGHTQIHMYLRMRATLYVIFNWSPRRYCK